MDKETKKPKCDTCGDTGEVPKPMPAEPHPCNYINLKRAEQTIPCPTCNGSSKVGTGIGKDGRDFDMRSPEILEPCPDCQQPKNQQPSSEFIKECEEYINGSPNMSNNNCKGYAERLKEACKIIDTSEQQRKDLLTALRDTVKPPHCLTCRMKAEAAIAKAKKGSQ